MNSSQIEQNLPTQSAAACYRISCHFIEEAQMHLRSNAQMLRSGTFDGSEAIELKQSLRTGFQDLREACILAEERSLANPCARGDCPDRHASKSSDALLLRCSDAEVGQDRASGVD